MSAHPPFVFCSIFFFSVPNRTYKPRFFFFLAQLELHVTGNEAPACAAVKTEVLRAAGATGLPPFSLDLTGGHTWRPGEVVWGPTALRGRA